MSDHGRGRVVAYVPFKTFLGAIELLERHMPNQIDSSLWPSYSGAIRSQLLNCFRFLDLIDANGRPTPGLKALVRDKAGRKGSLRKILETSYAPVVNLGLEKMTPRQFRDAMNEFGGMTGDTQKKVVSFFLRAARYSELPMAPLLSKNVRSAPSRRKADNDHRSALASAKVHQEHEAAREIAKSVELQSGGKLTVLLSANILELSSIDRAFVFGMIDKLQSYALEKKSTSR